MDGLLRLSGLGLLAVSAVAFASSFTVGTEQHMLQSDTSGAVLGKIPESNHADILKRFSSMPMRFEENRGQVDPSVDFFVRSTGYDVFISPTDAVVHLPPWNKTENPDETLGSVFRLRLIGASKTANAQGKDRLPGTTNYIKGKRGENRATGITSFARVGYSQVYPGIDLVYYGNNGALQYDFIVSPGANPELIRVALDGIDSLQIDDDGELAFTVQDRELKMSEPLIYQQIEGERRLIEGAYERVGERELAFRVAAYNADAPLIIDPVLQYSTYLGGDTTDKAMAIAVDTAGYAYVAGYTYSSDFPVVDAYDSRIGRSDMDVFVTKMDPSGSTLIYSTFIGGRNGSDSASGIEVDQDGNVYVVGSAGYDFPVTVGSYQTETPSTAGFVTKLNPSGNDLVFSTFVQGANINAVAVGPDRSAYITGEAAFEFQTSTSALFPNPPGSTDAFAARLSPDGTSMMYATFLGGTGVDFAEDLAVDDDGNAYVGGHTLSTDFPMLDAIQSSFRSSDNQKPDGFLSVLNPHGSALLFSSYLGGSLSDTINGVALDGARNIYLTGETYSKDFPVKGGFQYKAGYLMTNSSLGNAFVTKLSPFGGTIVYSSYLGGEICQNKCYSVFNLEEFPGDAAYDISVDGAGHAIVTGVAESYTFPRIFSELPAKTDDRYRSLFVTKINAAGSALLYSTLMGQENSYGDKMIAVDAPNLASVFVAGESWDTFPTTANAYKTDPPTSSLSSDAIVFRLDSQPVSITLDALSERIFATETVQLTAKLSEATLTENVVFLDGRYQIGQSAVVNGQASVTVQLSPGVHTLSAYYRSSEQSGSSAPKYLVVDAVRNCQ